LIIALVNKECTCCKNKLAAVCRNS